QELSESGDRGGEAEVLAARSDRSRDLAATDRPLDQLAGVAIRRLVPKAKVRDLLYMTVCGCGRWGEGPPLIAQGFHALTAATGQRDLVERGDAVAGADLAGVDLVVGEVLARQRAVLVADQPVLGDERR